jgi:chemotaxis protein CheX
MESEYIEALTKATTDLFSTMMAMELESTAVLTNRGDITEEIVITGIIGLAGAYKGTLAVHFTQAMALKSISAMLGMECEELSDDMRDAIGEVANIIAGGLKTELSARGITFDLSLPTIIAGNNYSVYQTDRNPGSLAIVPFSCGSDRMFIELEIAKSEN